MGFGQDAQGFHLVRGVIAGGELPQQHMGAVVQGNVDVGAGIVLHADVFEEGDKAHVGQRLVVIFDVAITLGRALVVVEGDARRDDVEHDGTAVGDGAFDQGK